MGLAPAELREQIAYGVVEVCRLVDALFAGWPRIARDLGCGGAANAIKAFDLHAGNIVGLLVALWMLAGEWIATIASMAEPRDQISNAIADAKANRENGGDDEEGQQVHVVVPDVPAPATAQLQR